MAKSNVFENDFLKLIFNQVPIAGLADPAAVPLTNLYVSLHNGNPDEDGNQSTNETSYGGYARIGVSRSTSGWAVVNNQVSNNVNVNFAQCTSGTDTITHVGVGTDETGTGKLLYYGALGASLAISPGVQPAFNVGGLIISED